MSKNRRRFTADFKAKIALEALKERKTLAQLAADHELHPNQIMEWKKRLLEASAAAFETSDKPDNTVSDKLIDDLKREIGTLYVELEWLKKKLTKF